MSSSLQDLLNQEGFRRRCRSPKHHPRRHRHTSSPALKDHPPSISLCRNRHSVDLLLPSSNANSNPDHDAIAPVVTLLSGYVTRFLKDPAFRRSLREKCSACLASSKDAAHAVLVNLEMGIDNIERLAANPSTSRESKIRSLRNSIRLLSIVASLNSPKSRSGYTCGVPNSHLSACAQLYLSVVYRIEKNDKISARHLLQVFCDAPYIARRNLLPDLWEQFFLPHLLHLKVWYNKEADMVSSLESEEKEQSMKGLNRVFNDQMDLGTAQFALYYKEWIKAGRKGVDAPAVPVPLRSSYNFLSGKTSLSVSPCSVNRSLYQAVFGSEKEDGGGGEGDLSNEAYSDPEREIAVEEGVLEHQSSVHTDQSLPSRHPHRPHRSPATHASTPSSRKSYSFRLFTCRTEAHRGGIRRSQVPKAVELPVDEVNSMDVPLINLGRAITLISTSDSLSECETAVRVIANAWLDSQGDPIVETALSTAAVIEGLLEVSFTSKDDEVLELAMSILAELVARSDVNRQVVLNADPQLELFLKLLGSNALFLKAASLLYLLKPKAKQMLSVEWVPLILRILEHGDQQQLLFAVQCSPKSAAFYLLDQLLTGFDVDRNVENAKQMVAQGGLNLLMRRLEAGDARERKNAASLLATCVRADGSCRESLAANIKKVSILELLTGNQLKTNGHALSLLVELICLRRRTQITNFLIGLRNEGCLNVMHILLVYLQQAPAEQRPLAASVLLQLDLLGDPTWYSVHREEGIDSLIGALDCSNSRKVQDRCSKALLVLGGRFSTAGEPSSEAWLLKRAGLDDCPADLYSSKEILAVAEDFIRPDEEENVIEDWLTRLAMVLLTRGGNRFLVALSNCIANATPNLARSCLVTVAWMSSSLSLLENVGSLWSMACSVLILRLLESLKYDRALEERVLASLTLLNFARNPECLSRLLPLDRDTEILLQDLTRFTWTAKEILFLAAADPSSVIGLR